MGKATISFAASTHFELQYLADGTVPVGDFEVIYPDPATASPPFFSSIASNSPYDIGELALSHYLIVKALGAPLTAVPVFPSKFFPHVGLTVNSNSGITVPSDLTGKRVGSPDWGFNPAVWTRGFLLDQYGVRPQESIWVESARQPLFPGVKYSRSSQYKHETVPVTDELNSDRAQVYGVKPLLESGEVDAVCYAGGGVPLSESTKRLFEDPVAEGVSYLKMTGVFPINTVLTLHQKTVEKYPNLPRALMEASQNAASIYCQSLEKVSDDTSYMGIPIKVIKNNLGFDTFRPGLEHNRAALETMLRYCIDQELVPQEATLGDFFLDG